MDNTEEYKYIKIVLEGEEHWEEKMIGWLRTGLFTIYLFFTGSDLLKQNLSSLQELLLYLSEEQNMN